MKRTVFFAGVSALILAVAAWAGEEQEETKESVVAEKFPLLTAGALTKARLADLPEGVLLRAESVEIKNKDIDELLKRVPEDIRGQLAKNLFFLLENVAAEHLLLLSAKKAGKGEEDTDDRSAIHAYLQGIASQIDVSDEEVIAFYDENKSMVGDMPFEQVKESIRQYLTQQKQQERIQEHIRTLGDRLDIRIARGWTEAQAKLAMDNPVDKARASGKPTMVEFGAQGCGPCDMMTPILEKLREKYRDRVNIVFLPVREEQIIASRYGIRSIPVQAFFDKSGREIFRHIGFFPQEECEKWLRKAGAE